MRRSFIRLLTDDSAGGTCGFVCAVSWIVGFPVIFDNVALSKQYQSSRSCYVPDFDVSIKEVGAI